ncbi:MAG: amidohydrolase family protein, partial [Bdellovibrio sp.]|nr:amidohydrolase family protein [Bdellovibrio sp.]
AEDWNLVGQGVMNEGALSNELGLRGNPAAAEEIMVAREIALCRLTRTPIHIAHISTAVALEHLRRAKEDGLPVTAEASPHHLTLTEECLRTYNTDYKMAPPLRSAKDVEALQEAVEKKWVEVIATDHAPHGTVDKALEFDQAANGILGLQTAIPVTLQLVHEKILSPRRWVESLSLGPAKILSLPFGTLKKEKDADVTLLKPDLKWTFSIEDIVSKSRNSPFLGQEFQGAVMATWVAGRLAYQRKGFKYV